MVSSRQLSFWARDREWWLEVMGDPVPASATETQVPPETCFTQDRQKYAPAELQLIKQESDVSCVPVLLYSSAITLTLNFRMTSYFFPWEQFFIPSLSLNLHFNA